MSDKTGGPAFPCHGVEYTMNGQQLRTEGTWPGMSLRDWFAGMALQGILTCEQVHVTTNQSSNEELSSCAYELADAMLAAR